MRGETPLHLAAANGHMRAAVELLAAGASVDLQDRSHKSPLDAALEAEQPGTVELLLEAMELAGAAEAEPGGGLSVWVWLGGRVVGWVEGARGGGGLSAGANHASLTMPHLQLPTCRLLMQWSAIDSGAGLPHRILPSLEAGAPVWNRGRRELLLLLPEHKPISHTSQRLFPFPTPARPPALPPTHSTRRRAHHISSSSTDRGKAASLSPAHDPVAH